MEKKRVILILDELDPEIEKILTDSGYKFQKIEIGPGENVIVTYHSEYD